MKRYGIETKTRSETFKFYSSSYDTRKMMDFPFPLIDEKLEVLRNIYHKMEKSAN